MNDKVLDFYHTEVPEKYGGKGIAAHLVEVTHLVMIVELVQDF